MFNKYDSSIVKMERKKDMSYLIKKLSPSSYHESIIFTL